MGLAELYAFAGSFMSLRCPLFSTAEFLLLLVDLELMSLLALKESPLRFVGVVRLLPFRLFLLFRLILLDPIDLVERLVVVGSEAFLVDRTAPGLITALLVDRRANELYLLLLPLLATLLLLLIPPYVCLRTWPFG